ncbi:MAG TPA: hypothetical protein VE910_04045 [Dongiaceae bacterium]|jgi:hypothetical protein|nr:hypothetical protein [Dongiaceae bacterium]
MLVVLVLSSRVAFAQTSWLPQTHPGPVLIADPYEPRLALGYFPADEHLHASLGGLFPMVSVRRDSLEMAVSLDGGAWLELGIEDDLFPLETVDGAFGLRIDAAKHVWRVTVRATHWSAHRADGDSTVAYPPRAVSREYGTIEVGLQPGSFYGFARIGAAWHSVPESNGAMVAAGIQWSQAGGTWRPVLAAHYEDDPARGDAPTWFLFAGAETGRRPLRLGLCWWKGPGPGGQHFEERGDRFGVEMQIAPLSR